MTARPWERLYPEGALDDLGVAGRGLPDMFATSIARFGDSTALSHEGGTWSFTQTGALVRHLAGLLTEAGLAPGHRAAVMLPNRPEYVVGLFAVWTAGGIVVQVNPRYVRVEVERILADSGAGLLITTADVAATLGELDWAGRILLVDGSGADAVDNSAGHTALDLRLTDPPAGDGNLTDVAGTPDVAVIQYTGGTTGAPKGVTLTHDNIRSNIEQRLRITFDAVEVPAGAKVLNVLPMSHVYGLTCATLMAIRTGMNQLVLSRFDVQDVLETIRDEQPFVFFGVPTMYTAFLRRDDLTDYGLDRVGFFNSAGSGLPVAQFREFEQRTGVRIVDGFGISEASPTTHTNPLHLEHRPGSAGIPVPFTDVRIVARTDREVRALPVGEVGELAVSGPQVMRGYWNRPELTAETLIDGWLMTGDLARVDDDGFVYIVGRAKDVIIASGLNIYPAEIEQVVGRIPGVVEVAVVGVPDDYRGETVKACIVLRDGAELTAEQVVEHCREFLSGFKIPRIVEFRPELPRTAVGKIDRVQLATRPSERLVAQ